jgi:hypothetical protein
MWYSLARCKLVEDGASRNSNKLSPILLLFLLNFVTSIIVILFLGTLGFVDIVGLGGDEMRSPLGWHRNYALFTSDDKMAEISPVFTVKPVLQSLIKMRVSEGQTGKRATIPWPTSRIALVP